MGRVALRGLFARKLRLVLTSLAVALGVTLIAGTYVFSDTFNHAFDNIFSEASKGTDASITPRKTIDTTDEGGTPPTIPPAVLERIRANPDVASASGSIFDVGTVLGKDGKRVGVGGAPNFIAAVAEVPRFDGFTVKEGRKPRTADEATIDAATADKENFKLGDRVCVSATAPRKCYLLVGTTQVAGVDSFGGATVVDLVLPEAQRILGKDGYDEIEAAAKPGTTPDQLKASLRAELPGSVIVRTGEEQAAKNSSDIRGDLGFLTTILLAFAGISLFVGAFIIFNTFSITVTQRIREFALLRTLGASRRQVMRSVITEGFALGLLGSLVGLGLGIALAPGLRALLKAFGLELPNTGNVIATRTIVVSLAVGTVVTLIASLAPALRATRVSPVEALREGALPTVRGVSRRTTIVGAVLLVGGIVLMCVGLLGGLATDAALSLVGAGALGAFLGVALFSPLLVRPLANLVGKPIESLRGVTGQLARENSIRLPGRTAVTAAALMIGVALVSFASIFAASARTSVERAVDQNLKSAFVVQNTDGFSPFSAQVLQAVKGVEGVSAVSGVRFSQAKVQGVSGNTAVSGIDPQTFPSLYALTPREGGPDAITGLRPGSALVGKGFAEDHGTDVGDTLRLTTPIGRTLTVRVTGEVNDRGGLTSAILLPNSVVGPEFGEPKDAFGMVGAAPGADVKRVQAAIARTLERQFPEAEVLTGQEFKDEIAGQINTLLGLIYALLALAIIVSLFGIVNTLVLSISERTRELGMLRAIGTSRKQVKRVIRYEALITALIGGVLGIVLGVVLAIIFTSPIDDFPLSIPVVTLLLVLVAAGIAGILAAILPARRAARLDVLEALAYE